MNKVTMSQTNSTLKSLKELNSQSVLQFCELIMSRINDGHIVTHIFPMPTDITYVFSDGIELSIGGECTLEQWYVETKGLSHTECLTDIHVTMYNPETNDILVDTQYSLNKV
jgi:hypothetical protein